MLEKDVSTPGNSIYQLFDIRLDSRTSIFKQLKLIQLYHETLQSSIQYRFLYAITEGRETQHQTGKERLPI